MLTGAALLCTFALTLSVFPVHATDSIESLESQTSALEKELAGINQDILDLSNQISDTEMQIEILNSSIDKTQDDLLDAEEKENKQYEDMKTRIKENTWATKEHIIRTKLLPYFGKLKMCNITAQQIITWQNEMLDHKDENGKKYSPAYLRSVNNQLSAIFNHAVRYYDLRENPCKKAGSMGKKKNRKMLFWTKEEYLKFADVMMDKPLSFYAFEMLYWCGIREGELLALTPGDFNFKAGTVYINKSYQRLHLYHFDPRWKRQNSTSEPQRATGLHHEPGKDGRWDSDLVPRLFPRNCSGGVHAVSSGIPEHYRQKTRG